MQRGTSAGGGGRHTRQSDLRSAVLGRRARCQALGIWALLLLAAYDLQFVRGRRIFPVLRYRGHRRLGCDRGEMAARVGMARRLDCARNGYLFLFVGTSVRMEDLRFRPKIPAELNSAGANKRTNCPCGPNRGQKRTAIPTNLQIHERLFNILRELSIGSSSGRIDDHRTADDFN